MCEDMEMPLILTQTLHIVHICVVSICSFLCVLWLHSPHQNA